MDKIQTRNAECCSHCANATDSGCDSMYEILCILDDNLHIETEVCDKFEKDLI